MPLLHTHPQPQKSTTELTSSRCWILWTCNWRVDQGGLKTLVKLEEALLTWEMYTAVVDQYPELNQRSLKVQLNIFKLQLPYTSTSEAAATQRNQLSEVYGLFNQVEALVQLLMVVPAASTQAERSSSVLRRFKIWLRSTTLQIRTNNLAVCHIYKEIKSARKKFARSLSLWMSTASICLVLSGEKRRKDRIEGWIKGVRIQRWDWRDMEDHEKKVLYIKSSTICG